MKKWVVKKKVGTLVIPQNPNGIHVVTTEEGEPEGDFDETLYWPLWVRDVEIGRVITSSLHSHTNILVTLDISPDGGMLASGSFNRTVIL